MEFRNIGRSGLRVSVVGLGCNRLGEQGGEENAREIVSTALDLGVDFFDTSDNYPHDHKGESERLLGLSLGRRRRDVVIATKFGIQLDEAGKLRGASRRYIMNAAEASLQRLQTDWIDLYQYHWPDAQTPFEETQRALDDLVRQGKVRYIGHCNFAGWQIADSAWIAKSANLTPYICGQKEYSLLARGLEQEFIPALQAHGIGLLPYFPLAGGLLTGKYSRDGAPPATSRFAHNAKLAQRFGRDSLRELVLQLQAFAEKHGHSLLNLSLSWLRSQPFIPSVIAGVTSAVQLKQNAAAIQSWSFSSDELDEINKLTLPK